MMHDFPENVDRSQWLPEGDPILTPERAAKGDVFTGPQCRDCRGSGRNPQEKLVSLACRVCHGKGWVGQVNAVGLDSRNIRHAQVQVRNVLNALWDREIITDDQHHDGGTYQIWRDMHNASLGLAKSVSSGGDEEIGVRLRAYGYVLLVRRLSRYDVRAIEDAIDTFANVEVMRVAVARSQAYLRAFDNLSRLLPRVKEQIKYLEGVTEDERQAMCEDNLKILLARLVKAM